MKKKQPIPEIRYETILLFGYAHLRILQATVQRLESRDYEILQHRIYSTHLVKRIISYAIKRPEIKKEEIKESGLFIITKIF